jgi:hypothetical protein
MIRQEFLRTATPHLIAEVRMYATTEGGRKMAALPGWGCPCMVSLTEPLVGYDALPILTDEPLLPGSTRRLGFYFLSGEEAAEVMRTSGHFFLWEGRAIGEAEVVG